MSATSAASKTFPSTLVSAQEGLCVSSAWRQRRCLAVHSFWLDPISPRPKSGNWRLRQSFRWAEPHESVGGGKYTFDCVLLDFHGGMIILCGCSSRLARVPCVFHLHRRLVLARRPRRCRPALDTPIKVRQHCGLRNSPLGLAIGRLVVGHASPLDLLLLVCGRMPFQPSRNKNYPNHWTPRRERHAQDERKRTMKKIRPRAQRSCPARYKG